MHQILEDMSSGINFFVALEKQLSVGLFWDLHFYDEMKTPFRYMSMVKSQSFAIFAERASFVSFHLFLKSGIPKFLLKVVRNELLISFKIGFAPEQRYFEITVEAVAF